MTRAPSFPHAISADRPASRLRDRIQMALAIADESFLRSMLINSYPAITREESIGHISSAICLAAPNNQTVDGIVEYEKIQCQLAPTQNSQVPQAVDYGWNACDYQRHTHYQSDTYLLADQLPIHEADILLQSVGFHPQQSQQILQMPPSATFKSWWYTCDETGELNLPFLRIIHTIYYANGTVSLKYRDAFERYEPPCFRSKISKVLVEIRPTITSFARTLARINRHRTHNSVDSVILITDSLDPDVVEAFVSQGISLYPDIQITQTLTADCRTCQNHSCLLQGKLESPVTACNSFQPSGKLKI